MSKAAAKGKKMLGREKIAKGTETLQAKQKVAMLGARLKCPFHPSPGTLIVTSNQVRLQGTIWATDADNSKQNLVFPGICLHPSNAATKAPCIVLIIPVKWSNTGTVKVQNHKTLLKKSTNKCSVSGQNITIIHEGQTSKPSISLATSPDVPMEGEGVEIKKIERKPDPPREVTREDINKAIELANKAKEIAMKYSNKTVALDGINTVSGWSDGRGVSKTFVKDNDIEKVPLAQVYATSEELDNFNFSENASLDNDMPGSGHACHAEKQIIAMQLGEPIGVSREMCPCCREYAQAMATATNDPIVVCDGINVYIFNPNSSKTRTISLKEYKKIKS